MFLLSIARPVWPAEKSRNIMSENTSEPCSKCFFPFPRYATTCPSLSRATLGAAVRVYCTDPDDRRVSRKKLSACLLPMR